MTTAVQRIFTDLLRVGILMLLVGVLLYLADPANAVVFQAMGIAVFLVGGTHLTRRVLFHQIDLQSIARRAMEENNFAAAIIFAAVIYFLVEVMRLSMTVLK